MEIGDWKIELELEGSPFSSFEYTNNTHQCLQMPISDFLQLSSSYLLAIYENISENQFRSACRVVALERRLVAKLFRLRFHVFRLFK